MKLIWIIGAMLMVVACTDDIKTTQSAKADDTTGVAKPAYDDSWFLSPGWPGEYPNGFTILHDGVVLAGRAEMNKAAPKLLQCPVPRLANYNQWNQERGEADGLEFIAAAKTFELEVLQDGNVLGVADEDDVMLALKAGETLTYLTYVAEGFGLIRFNGVEYQINEADLEGVVDFSAQRDVADDLWVNIPCADKQRGWVLYAEVQGMEGIGETEHTEYGVSRDLAE